MTRHIRRIDVVALVRRLAAERRTLLDLVATQRVEMAQQQALIREQQAAIREMADGVRELKAMAVRNGLLDLALDVKREESPLQ
jgi:hypothetical protein